jgi:distribution and morphology protein 31
LPTNALSQRSSNRITVLRKTASSFAGTVDTIRLPREFHSCGQKDDDRSGENGAPVQPQGKRHHNHTKPTHDKLPNVNGKSDPRNEATKRDKQPNQTLPQTPPNVDNTPEKPPDIAAQAGQPPGGEGNPQSASPLPNYENYPESLRRLAMSLPHLHRPTRDDFLSIASGFWQRARIRFKWFTIKSFRKFNADDISAFVTWFLTAQFLWILVGT